MNKLQDSYHRVGLVAPQKPRPDFMDEDSIRGTVTAVDTGQVRLALEYVKEVILVHDAAIDRLETTIEELRSENVKLSEQLAEVSNKPNNSASKRRATKKASTTTTSGSTRDASDDQEEDK